MPRPWDAWVAEASKVAAQVGGVISRTAASAQELLKDQELRKCVRC